MSIEHVATYLQSIAAAVETRQQWGELTRSFSLPPELEPAARELMIDAAAGDAKAPAGDEFARWGKWHRAANIVNEQVENWCRARGLSLTTGDWSWYAFQIAVGNTRERIAAEAKAERGNSGW